SSGIPHRAHTPEGVTGSLKQAAARPCGSATAPSPASTVPGAEDFVALERHVEHGRERGLLGDVDAYVGAWLERHGTRELTERPVAVRDPQSRRVEHRLALELPPAGLIADGVKELDVAAREGHDLEHAAHDARIDVRLPTVEEDHGREAGTETKAVAERGGGAGSDLGERALPRLALCGGQRLQDRLEPEVDELCPASPGRAGSRDEGERERRVRPERLDGDGRVGNDAVADADRGEGPLDAHGHRLLVRFLRLALQFEAEDVIER